MKFVAGLQNDVGKVRLFHLDTEIELPINNNISLSSQDHIFLGIVRDNICGFEALSANRQNITTVCVN